MIGRLLALVLVLCAPCFAQVDVDTFKTTTEVDDVQMRKAEPDGGRRNYDLRNYGASTGLSFTNGDSTKFRVLMRINQSSLTSKIQAGYMVKKAILWFKTGLIVDTFTIGVYKLNKNWYEGTGTGVDADFLPLGGATWWHSKTPTGGKPTLPASAPTSMNWADSGYTSSIKNQGGCNTCWSFAMLNQIESLHKKDIFIGSTTYNSEDGSGADRSIAALATDSSTAVQQVITSTGWKRYTIPSVTATMWYNGTDNGMMFISDSGDVKFSSAEGANCPIFRFHTITKKNGLYTERSGTSALRIATSASILDAYINSASTTTNYGSADSLRANSTMRFIIRTDSLRKLINDTYYATNDTLYSITAAYCSLYVSAVYANATVKMYDMYKTHWLEDQVTWNVWKTNYEWGLPGASQTEEIDLAEQQVLNCVTTNDCNGGGYLEDVLQLAVTDSLTGERYLPYRGFAQSCPDNDTMLDDTKVGWAYPWKFSSADSLKKILTIQPVALIHKYHTNTPKFRYWTWDPLNDKCFYNSTDTTTINHAELLVGYDDNFACDAGEGTGAWIFKNQYGTGLGRAGYWYVAYNSVFLKDYSTANGDRVYTLTYDSTATTWSSGGLAAGNDYDASPVAVKRIDGQGSTWYGIEIPAYLVQGWLNGNIPNYGIVAIADNLTTRLPQALNSSEAVSDQPIWQIFSSPATTQIGTGNYGNMRIGQ